MRSRIRCRAFAARRSCSPAAASDGELTTLITTEVDRIAALIDRMQDFTDTRPLDADAEQHLSAARSCPPRRAGRLRARHVSIEERFDPSLPPVLIDRDALLQVVLNLLKNAAEAMAGQADAAASRSTTAYRHGMAVSAAPGAPRQPLPIEICVIDNGPGAPADIADHLFDPFVSGKPEGQGLGLALVDKLVRDMGGIVQYAREGEPEMTVFRILLPQGAAMSRTGTILVVDDDAAIRTVVGAGAAARGPSTSPPPAIARRTATRSWPARHARRAGHRCRAARRQWARSWSATLIAEHPGLPVIVLSAQNTLTTAVRATEVGAYRISAQAVRSRCADAGGARRAGARRGARSRRADRRGRPRAAADRPLAGDAGRLSRHRARRRRTI